MRIGQILINLVSNALKFTQKDEIDVHFDASTLDTGQIVLRFSVRDTGSGIDNSQLDAIFDSFTQTSTTPADSGTGLGLTICRTLVEMLHGRIHATSEPGVGSTFHFSIEVEREQQREAVATEPDQAMQTARRTNTPNRAKFEAYILLVEDNLINQDLAREFLQRAGYQVILANNGAEALDALDAAPYLAVLMDVRMPVMDGYEAVGRIREMPGYQDMPVIALSAGVLKSEVERAIEAGFDHYLSKPIDFDALLHLLDDLRCDQSETSIVQLVPSPPPSEDTIGIDFRLALRNHDGDDATPEASVVRLRLPL